MLRLGLQLGTWQGGILAWEQLTVRFAGLRGKVVDILSSCRDEIGFGDELQDFLTGQNTLEVPLCVSMSMSMSISLWLHYQSEEQWLLCADSKPNADVIRCRPVTLPHQTIGIMERTCHNKPTTDLCASGIAYTSSCDWAVKPGRVVYRDQPETVPDVLNAHEGVV